MVGVENNAYHSSVLLTGNTRMHKNATFYAKYSINLLLIALGYKYMYSFILPFLVKPTYNDHMHYGTASAPKTNTLGGNVALEMQS